MLRNEAGGEKNHKINIKKKGRITLTTPSLYPCTLMRSRDLTSGCHCGNNNNNQIRSWEEDGYIRRTVVFIVRSHLDLKWSGAAWRWLYGFVRSFSQVCIFCDVIRWREHWIHRERKHARDGSVGWF